MYLEILLFYIKTFALLTFPKTLCYSYHFGCTCTVYQYLKTIALGVYTLQEEGPSNVPVYQYGHVITVIQ